MVNQNTLHSSDTDVHEPVVKITAVKCSTHFDCSARHQILDDTGTCPTGSLRDRGTRWHILPSAPEKMDYVT